MIIGLIVTAVLAGLDALVSLFPTIDISGLGGAGYDGTIHQIASIASILPLLTIVEAAGLVMAVVLALYAWDLIVWIYHQFWGSN